MNREDWIHSQCKEDDRILDVGADNGWVWKACKFPNLVLLDINEFPPGKFPRVVGDAHNLPFDDNSFDITCLCEILEHVHNPILVIREATRVARKKVVFTVPDEYHWTAPGACWTGSRREMETGKPLVELVKESSPDSIKVHSLEQAYHNRFYTKEILESQLAYTNLPYEIQTIAYDGWSWFCGIIVKEKPEITSNGLVKLNLGSFVDTFGFNWANIDILDVRGSINPEHKFTQCDLRGGIPYPNNSVDLIYTSHLIEHLTLEDAHSLLLEIYRVLKPGGLARISTPDAQIILRHYLNHDMDYFNGIQPSEFIDAPTAGEKLSRLLFSGNYEHRGVYDFDMLKSSLMQVGFAAEDIHSTSAKVSASPIMQAETKNPHVPISLICEAIKEKEYVN